MHDGQHGYAKKPKECQRATMPSSIGNERNERTGEDGNTRAPSFSHIRGQVCILVKNWINDQPRLERPGMLVTCSLAVDQHVKSKKQNQYGNVDRLVVTKCRVCSADCRWEMHGPVDDRQYEARSCD